MNKKILMSIFGIVFLVGLATAFASAAGAGVVTNVTGININNVYGGETAHANFGFDYEDYYGINEFPHVIQINITSSNVNEPVWKNDFRLNGFVRKSTFFGLFHTDVPFSCNESSPLTINNKYLGVTKINNVPNGTFYCYNETSGIIANLSKHDEVYLNLTPNIMIWPGEYNLSVGVYHITDNLPPFVNITNKADFDRYYKPGEYLEVRANISDNVGMGSYYGAIYNGSTRYIMSSSGPIGGLYYFTDNSIPTNLSGGNYPLTITAVDTSGNVGNDTVTLKLDETGPTIVLNSPGNNSIVKNMLDINATVTDNKSGVNESEVYYRLREMNGTNICPTSGVGTWNCYNSGWVNLPYNGSSTYFKSINTTAINLTSGQYWLEIKALDNLGNIGILS